jgi:hypothetical protein
MKIIVISTWIALAALVVNQAMLNNKIDNRVQSSTVANKANQTA